MVYRRYRRPLGRSRYVLPKRTKYSVEQKNFQVTLPTTQINNLNQTALELVEPIAIQGMRKVKHLMVNLALTGTTNNDTMNPLYWAIVYVPQGTLIGNMQLNGTMYEPNQYVMNCGVVDPTAGPIRFSSPLSRNLNSGDSIYLLVGMNNLSGMGINVCGCSKYAITLN